MARGEALLSRLRAPDSPVDFVGLSLFADSPDFTQVDADFSRRSEKLDDGPERRPVFVLEVECSPRANGGEPGNGTSSHALSNSPIQRGACEGSASEQSTTSTKTEP